MLLYYSFWLLYYFKISTWQSQAAVHSRTLSYWERSNITRKNKIRFTHKSVNNSCYFWVFWVWGLFTSPFSKVTHIFQNAAAVPHQSWCVCLRISRLTGVRGSDPPSSVSADLFVKAWFCDWTLLWSQQVVLNSVKRVAWFLGLTSADRGHTGSKAGRWRCLLTVASALLSSWGLHCTCIL